MKNGRRFWPLAAVGAAVLMLGMSFAAVPLYSLFCRTTGYAGTTKRAAAAPTRVIDRPMEVSFDTNVAPGVPLEFKADEPSRIVKPGETALVFFRVRNTGDKTIHASATYNVAPFKAAIYFQKLECFCFEPHDFAPGETVQLPVVFFVDPRIAEDRDTQELSQLTLSYTYFATAPKDGGAKTAALAPGRDVATP